MKLFYANEPYNFGGIPEQDFKSAKVVVLPVPYDSTAYYKSGQREGPKAIIEASRHMELYDIELGKEICEEVGIYTLDELQPSKNSPKETMDRISEAVSEIFKSGKFPVVLGGEHSVAIGCVQAAVKFYKDLTVLQIDAHGDMRDEWESTKYSHACAMRRCRELAKDVVQCGIRSISKEEIDYIKKSGIKNIFFMPDFDIDKILGAIKTKDVYVSWDLDSLDPCYLPSTGTPEPSGLSYSQILSLMKKLCKEKNVVGLDANELMPIPGIHHPEFGVAKAIYKIMGYKFLLT